MIFALRSFSSANHNAIQWDLRNGVYNNGALAVPNPDNYRVFENGDLGLIFRSDLIAQISPLFGHSFIEIPISGCRNVDFTSIPEEVDKFQSKRNYSDRLAQFLSIEKTEWTFSSTGPNNGGYNVNQFSMKKITIEINEGFEPFSLEIQYSPDLIKKRHLIDHDNGYIMRESVWEILKNEMEWPFWQGFNLKTGKRVENRQCSFLAI